jgi:hypothetical protein
MLESHSEQSVDHCRCSVKEKQRVVLVNNKNNNLDMKKGNRKLTGAMQLGYHPSW